MTGQRSEIKACGKTANYHPIGHPNGIGQGTITCRTKSSPEKEIDVHQLREGLQSTTSVSEQVSSQSSDSSLRLQGSEEIPSFPVCILTPELLQ